MDNQDVAVRPTRDFLADAATEQPLEETGFPGADDDQLSSMLLGGVDELLRRPAGYARELDVQAGFGEKCLYPRAMLLPQLLVPFGTLIGVARRVGGIRQETERPRSADLW